MFFLGGVRGGGETVYDFLGLLGKKMSILELLNQNTSRLIMSPLTRSGGGTYCFWRQRKTSCPLCNLNIFGIF